MAVKPKKLKKQLMEKIDQTDLMQVEKVERYINLIELFNSLDGDVKKHGTMIEVVNGSQQFNKPNPAIAEKVKISASLLAIEKAFEFDIKEETQHSASDLI
ncbi:P27 family phage terminase small subunit [Peribacillus sp. CSMR9]|uniref:P27 family phage terminase small subunit n=1 Tax=Peribacillus sp. CSMR9 TaxID=2981350 RepID=UPI002952AB56|nr:P27 family phage terminase small subunit [Peribacillus sp. CSMR9]MDV7767774.1 P27 family phage terminase small subunit [Peribacillus sp. CSMR9]